MKTEKEVREEYNQMRNDDPAFAECWDDDDHDQQGAGQQLKNTWMNKTRKMKEKTLQNSSLCKKQRCIVNFLSI